MKLLSYSVVWLVIFTVEINCKSEKKNIVFVLTDDQDLVLNGLVPMKKTLELIANEGVTFSSAFVSTPICCPSRSSILTGLYTHNHKAFNNSAEGGCDGKVWRSIENKTFGALLHDAGYKTFYSGKYLNQYNGDYIPKGWDWWAGLVQNSKYYNYTLSLNGTSQFYGDEYLPDVMTTFALEFIESIDESKPFLMVLSTPSPHSPSTPAPRHKGTFKNIKALRTSNFNKHYPDKHWLLNMSPETLSDDALNYLDEVYRNRWESLLAVDEMVEAVVHALDEKKVLDDTYIIFTSDNGYHMGQFAQAYDKRQPYESDTNVPLLIRGPGIPKKSMSHVPIANIDFFPTILQFAGINIPNYIDGISFYEKIITNNDVKYNSAKDELERQILFEYWGEAKFEINSECPWKNDHNLARCDPRVDCRCQDVRNNTYSCVRHIATDLNLLFCQFEDSEGFVEFYDLDVDPLEEKNIAYSILPAIREKYILILSHLKTCGGKSCKVLY